MSGRAPTWVGFDPAPLLREVRHLTHHEAAELLGVGYSTVAKWRQGRQRIGPYFADRVATRLGLHPADLWPEWFDDAA